MLTDEEIQKDAVAAKKEILAITQDSFWAFIASELKQEGDDENARGDYDEKVIMLLTGLMQKWYERGRQESIPTEGTGHALKCRGCDQKRDPAQIRFCGLCIYCCGTEHSEDAGRVIQSTSE